MTPTLCPAATRRLQSEQAHLLGVLGDNPDDLGCLERLKEVDFAMGLLLRPAVESPRPKVIDDDDERETPQAEDDYGARDASPMPLGENAYSADDYDDEAEELANREEERRWQSPEPRHAHALGDFERLRAMTGRR